MTEESDGVARPVKKSARMERLGYLLCGALLGVIFGVALTAGITWGIGELKLIYAREASASEEGRNGGQSFLLAKDEMAARLEAVEKEHREHIDKELEHSKMLLDGLVAMVGVYTVLLGLTAFMTVKFSRDDAKEKLESFQKALDVVQESFPQFAKMDERMLLVMSEIVRRMPSEDDWSDDKALSSVDEFNRQYILDSEIVVAAASVFALERSPGLQATVFTIYMNFARFHATRFKDATAAEGNDFARAVRFAGKAIQVNNTHPEGYRRRGAIWLDGYEKLKSATTPQEIERRENLLGKAENDLDEAVRLCQGDELDAGAYYNRALAHFHRKKINEAIDLSEELLKPKNKRRIPNDHWYRFMPDVFINLGGYYVMVALEAKRANDTATENEYSERAVKAVERGITEPAMAAGAGRALTKIKKLLKRELDEKKELGQLDPAYVTRLRAHL